MVATSDIKRAIDQLKKLKEYPRSWTPAEAIKLWEVIHVVDTRVQEQKNATPYTKTEIDRMFQAIRDELERRAGSW